MLRVVFRTSPPYLLITLFSTHTHLNCTWIIIMTDGMVGEGELLCNGEEGVLHREIIWGSIYLKFLKANFRQILGRAIPWKYGLKFFLTLEMIWGKRHLKVSRKFVCIWTSEETDVCSEILRKFKGNAKKLLKRAILRKFFLYFGNIFRNNCVIRNFE